MEQVGIKTLKNRLSEYVRAAAAGRSVLVTDRGRVVAELIAPRVSQETSDEMQRLGELMRRGLLSPAKAGPEGGVPARRPVTTLEEVLRDLGDSRASR
jgi:prevent-host-death family protein